MRPSDPKDATASNGRGPSSTTSTDCLYCRTTKPTLQWGHLVNKPCCKSGLLWPEIRISNFNHAVSLTVSDYRIIKKGGKSTSSLRLDNRWSARAVFARRHTVLSKTRHFQVSMGLVSQDRSAQAGLRSFSYQVIRNTYQESIHHERPEPPTN